jgi:hypothetical protein
MGVPLTHALAQNQKRAMDQARATQDGANHGATTLETQETGPSSGKVIYVYNILALDHVVEQPPVFPHFAIPACQKGQKFSYTLLPEFVKIPFTKPGTTEMYYKSEDGRKAATSLMNPMAFPSTDWNAQVQKWDTGDQFGNNLNMFGCWWSLKAPDDPTLDEEIKIFKDRWMKTMQELINAAETLNAQGNRKDISPLMHFAMDYAGKQAQWHMSTEHMISCPNCGALVKDGIAYHKNDFGDKCVLDWEKTYQAGAVKLEDVPFEKRWWNDPAAEEELEPAGVPASAAPAARKTKARRT